MVIIKWCLLLKKVNLIQKRGTDEHNIWQTQDLQCQNLSSV